MKSKKFTYLLGLLVVAVWGLIIYRVYASRAGGDDGSFPPVPTKAVKEPYNDYTVPTDTSHLQLNYPDPFVLKKQKDTVTIPVKKLLSDRLPVKPAVNWTFIKYSGYIRNPGSRNLVAIVSINGKTVMLVPGETAEQVKLLKNLQDSVQVMYNGKTTYIKIRSGAL
jgi:hypothetical protein